jgi:hypothetical protein
MAGSNPPAFGKTLTDHFGKKAYRVIPLSFFRANPA